MVNLQKVLAGWTALRGKLKTVLLNPKEKADWKFLESSRTAQFSIYEFNLGRTDLNQLKNHVEVERQKEIADDTENDLLLDYWLVWTNYGALILDWIGLKQSCDYYKDENKKLQQEIENQKSRIEVFEGIRDKITNFSDVSRSFHRDEPTTFFALARSEWPKVLAWGESAKFPEVLSSALLTVETLTNDRSDYVRKSLEMFKETEKTWSQKILPRIRGAFD